jgi:hypothetical protein
MIAQLLAALLATTALPDSQASAQPQVSNAESEQAVRLEDVEVTGRRLDSLIQSFVNEVAAPNSGRGIARWDRTICVGVANLRGDAAHYIVDRVSTVAEDLGLKPGQPGCQPNLLIVATDDGNALATHMAENNKRALRMGGSGMDQGGAALRRFQETDRPVRWWQVSMPVDSETGQRATRIFGECRPPCQSPMDYAPVINTFSASRLRTQIVDNIFRTVVIVDVDDINQVSITQLADYIAMVSLAQINPEADTSAYASILNVFDDPSIATGLTEWDKAYLGGLYDAERSQKNLRSGKTEIATSIQRAHTRLAEAPQETDAPRD